jgi:hypothetical protein
VRQLVLRIAQQPIEDVEADALLVPVDAHARKDGRPVLGGAALAGARAWLKRDGLTPEDIVEAVAALEEAVPTEWPGAGGAFVIDGVARWQHVVVADCFAHNAGGGMFSAAEMAGVVASGVRAAVAAAGAARLASLASTLVGTATRLTVEQAARAFATAQSAPLDVIIAVPDAPTAARVRVALRLTESA